LGLTARELCSNSIQETPAWFALAVRYQYERRTQQYLVSRGLEALSPFYRVRRNWSDRAKEIELPLFAGYVFCRFNLAQKRVVLDTPGVVKVVGFGGRPAALPDGEIEEIRCVIGSGLAVRPWPYLKAGDRVRVRRGPLRGVEGTLLREKNSMRLIVSVELLQRAISVELDPEAISPVRPWPQPARSSSPLVRSAV
jgi:transcription antitermination factor NusG